ncbi:DUF6624 domain-containing protein [Pedobacter caeni]|uniref:Uncharacterized protein n=1 Tax=Pedobacter caeni TaxID=288992 RepID=A0A1M5C0I9_9SPHI|nr:DUF6624 domain-containing protein [Pedobacter caeni]SHF48180.1 hypothetical protein SAMN04488522_1021438 [Pedobacter caeni]
MLYQEIATKLVQLAENDLSVRQKLLNQGKLSKGYHPEMEAVHQANSKVLKKIISEIGYPTINKVGHKASDAAWLIVQHAIGEPEFMQECYSLMLEQKQDIATKNIAYLYDRIQVYRSKPQKYGTQMISKDVLFPVENPLKINIYRSEVGLPELSEKQIQLIPDCDQIQLIDNQDEEYNLWRKKIGWI